MINVVGNILHRNYSTYENKTRALKKKKKIVYNALTSTEVDTWDLDGRGIGGLERIFRTEDRMYRWWKCF